MQSSSIMHGWHMNVSSPQTGLVAAQSALVSHCRQTSSIPRAQRGRDVHLAGR
jgi:hypothetical protein